MVNENILVRARWKWLKRLSIVLGVLILIGIILVVVFFAGFFINFGGKTEIILENPLKNIIFANTVEGKVDKSAVVEQGILEFNENYINYVLVGLGVGNLYKSFIYGNPIVEFVIDDEIWSSEVNKGNLITKKKDIDNEDLKIIISREEMIYAILTASDIENFMKNSVRNGNTQIEMVAGKIELGSKGYLIMYKQLTGEEIEIE